MDSGGSTDTLRVGNRERHLTRVVSIPLAAVQKKRRFFLGGETAAGERPVTASTTGGLWLSEDGGESWAAAPARLPPVYAVRFG
jgi:hypothetical protein